MKCEQHKSHGIRSVKWLRSVSDQLFSAMWPVSEFNVTSLWINTPRNFVQVKGRESSWFSVHFHHLTYWFGMFLNMSVNRGGCHDGHCVCTGAAVGAALAEQHISVVNMSETEDQRREGSKYSGSCLLSETKLKRLLCNVYWATAPPAATLVTYCIGFSDVVFMWRKTKCLNVLTLTESSHWILPMILCFLHLKSCSFNKSTRLCSESFTF